VDNTPSFRGMIKKVLHLVSVREVEGGAGAKASVEKATQGGAKAAQKEKKS
jgi:hypothetical protein